MPDRRYELTFEMTAEGIEDASRLYQQRQYRLIGAAGVVELAAAALLIGLGNDLLFAALLGVFGLFSLVLTQSPLFLRWQIRRMARGVLGTSAKVEMDSSGFTFANEQSSGHIEWSGLTEVRDNQRIVLLVRGRTPYAWIPSAAFASTAQRGEIVSFMRDQIAAAHGAPRAA